MTNKHIIMIDKHFVEGEKLNYFMITLKSIYLYFTVINVIRKIKH